MLLKSFCHATIINLYILVLWCMCVSIYVDLNNSFGPPDIKEMLFLYNSLNVLFLHGNFTLSIPFLQFFVYYILFVYAIHILLSLIYIMNMFLNTNFNLVFGKDSHGFELKFSAVQIMIKKWHYLMYSNIDIVRVSLENQSERYQLKIFSLFLLS